MRTREMVPVLVGGAAIMLAGGRASAQQAGWHPKGKGPAASQQEDDATRQARQAFREGTNAVEAGQWSAALASFERADALKASPVVTFNIGYCQRALGRYVQARRSFQAVLARPEGMPQGQVQEASAYLEEIDRLLARLRVTVDPPSARIAIDGRPLVPLDPADPSVLVAGLAPPGEGKPPPKPVFDLVIDPGVHLVHASRPGHTDVLLNKTFAPGSRAELSLKLDELPATVRVESNQPRAVVTLDDRDVGLAPIDITRPAGRYRLQVLKKGFITYDSTLALAPGQKANITARLVPEEESLTQKWWFWGGAAALVAGGITATYFLTRPDAQPPDYQRGSLNWVAAPQWGRW